MEPPVVVGLHVCERVTEDPVTGSVTMFNRLAVLESDEFPATLAFRVEIEQLSDRLLVHEFPTMIEFDDRLKEVVFTLDFPEIVFWFPGTYDVSLSIDGEPITKCQILLLESPRTSE